MKTLVPIAAAAALCACASWPDHGHGGFAEHRGKPAPAGTEIVTHAAELTQELDLQSIALDVLILKGARLCLPARVEVALIQKVRTERALVGGLMDDAENDLIVLRHRVEDIQRRLAYLEQHTQCVGARRADSAPQPSEQADATAIQNEERQRIHLLLNSHGQFASGMAELLPQYQHALQLAAQLLKSDAPAKITVYGHTDNIGHDKANDQLGKQRAEAVRAALIRFGLDSDVLAVDSNGERSPLADNSGPTGRLANRRVEVVVQFSEQSPRALKPTTLILKNWGEVTEELSRAATREQP